MAHDQLITYLNDHLGGSNAALQLLEQMSTRETTESRAFYMALLKEVTADRETLEDLIRRVGGEPSVLRDVGGWLTEKAHRLKMMWDDPSGEGLHELQVLEILQIGIYGKGALWRALHRAGEGIPSVQNVDYGRLEQRAENQMAQVEARRLAVAERVLSRRTADV